MSANPNRPLAFVTATKLEHFKGKRVMQKIRKAVMRDYLHKTTKDGQSTVSNRTASQSPLESTIPSTMAPPSGYLQHNKAVKRRDSRASFSEGQHSRPSSLATSPGAEEQAPTSATSAASSIGLNPMIRTTTNQQALFALADDLNRRTVNPNDHGHTDFDAIMAPGSAIVTEKMQFIVAFTRSGLRHTMPDPFARAEPLPNTVDLDRLKINCATYFGSQGMADQWLPLMLASPQAFLASLCISAPYTDLMTATQDGQDPSSYTDTRQTLEILDIVPRMINDSLNEHGNCDSNITAVVQLLFGQLSTPYTALVGSHQVALKRMVTSRGGLDKLGGNGVLAMNVALINMEANILRSEPADPLYLDWCSSYLEKGTKVKTPSPEGPLHWLDDGLRSIATSRLCNSETLELIILMQDLTEKIIRLRKLNQAEKEDASRADDHVAEKAMIKDRIRVIFHRVHTMPECWRVIRDGQPDWVYESVRLASLLYCHAIWYQKPLHHKFACSMGSACRVTPETLQDTIRLSPVRPVWDHLAGVLYWVLMIGAAACHDPVGEEHDDELELLTTDLTSISSPSDYENKSPPFFWPSVSEAEALAARCNEPPSQHFHAAVHTFSAGKRMFHEYVQERDTNKAADQILGLNISEPQSAIGVDLCSPYGSDRAQCVPLFLRDTGFVTPVSAEEATLSSSMTATCSTTTEPKRQRTVEKKRSDEAERQRRRDKRSYVRRYLTANAVRVSVLLRFEHTPAIVTSVQRLEEVTRWLNRM